MSFQYLTEETKLTIIPANCPDVSFWTLVNFSWWWGESAENKKLTPTSSEHLLVLCHYLWIIEVGRQLHEYWGQKLGDIVGERLHKCTQSKDSTEIFFCQFIACDMIWIRDLWWTRLSTLLEVSIACLVAAVTFSFRNFRPVLKSQKD